MTISDMKKESMNFILDFSDSVDFFDEAENIYEEVSENELLYLEERESSILSARQDYQLDREETYVSGTSEKALDISDDIDEQADILESDLFDSYSELTPHVSEFDSQSLHADEFDGDASQYKKIEVKIDGRVDRTTRAQQVAFEIGDEFDLEKKDIEFLADLFDEKGWSAAKKAIYEAMKENITMEDIRFAHEIKELWLEHCEFVGARGKYDILSWSAAFTIIRCFSAYPDLVEIENLLLELYDKWRNDINLIRMFRKFGVYVFYFFRNSDGTLETMQGHAFKNSF